MNTALLHRAREALTRGRLTAPTSARLQNWLADPHGWPGRDDDEQQLARLLDTGDINEIETAFCADLGLGTAGCRAKVGLGTARFNTRTVSIYVRALSRWLRLKG